MYRLSLDIALSRSWLCAFLSESVCGRQVEEVEGTKELLHTCRFERNAMAR